MSLIPCPIKIAAKKSPNTIAISSKDKKFTYQQLDGCIEYNRKNLRCKLGEKIVVCSPNSWQMILLFFICLREKAIFCPINRHLPTSQIDSAREFLSSKRFFSEMDLQKEISDKQLPFPSDDAFLDSEQLATVLFTSGSTNRPKAALHTFSQHLQSALISNQHLNFKQEQSWLLSLPLFHVSGLSILFRCISARATIYMAEQEGIIDGLQKVSHASLVPTQLFRILQKPLFSHFLQCILVGGSALNKALYKQAVKYFPIYCTYGLTELSSQVFTTNQPHFDQENIFLGHPLEGIEAKLVDQELYLRGKTLFQGYFNTNTSFEWFETKDLAIYDPQWGYAIIGRKDNLFISGGENIQAEEIERVLLSYPLIESAIVVPIKDPEMGQRPVAFISPYCEEKILYNYLQKFLPSYKIPVSFLKLKNFGWKPSRQTLKKQAERLKKIS